MSKPGKNKNKLSEKDKLGKETLKLHAALYAIECHDKIPADLLLYVSNRDSKIKKEIIDIFEGYILGEYKYKGLFSFDDGYNFFQKFIDFILSGKLTNDLAKKAFFLFSNEYSGWEDSNDVDVKDKIKAKYNL